MRTAFLDALLDVAARDERVHLLCGDLGFSVLEPFKERFPDRFLNVGVAEQNMTGIAAGLASCGKVVFTYSIANFPVMRCLEQIRNDVAYHNLPVCVVAVGGGVAYGAQGYSHHGTEDLAVMRVLPNMTVLAPGDPFEARWAAQAAVDVSGPCYLRLGKAGEPVVHEQTPELVIGRAARLMAGDDATIVSTGGMLPNAHEAASALRDRGVNVTLLSMHTLEPVDVDAIRAAARTGVVVTVEEHGVGGLASVVSEVLATSGLSPVFTPLCMGRAPHTKAGSQATLRNARGLSVDGIVTAVLEGVDRG